MQFYCIYLNRFYLPNNNTVFVYKTVCCLLTCMSSLICNIPSGNPWKLMYHLQNDFNICIGRTRNPTFPAGSSLTFPASWKFSYLYRIPFRTFSEKCVMSYECTCLGNEILRLEISDVLTDKPFLKSSLCVWADHANRRLTTHKMVIWALI